MAALLAAWPSPGSAPTACRPSPRADRAGPPIGLAAWPAVLPAGGRGEFLSLRERASSWTPPALAGASSGRIIFKHILPNTVGVITGDITLLMSSAILLETSLLNLGSGSRPRTGPGRLITRTRRRSPPGRGCSGGRVCSSWPSR
ncbi:hypothetical protein QJS66_21900 [Kocuria rhizophila]|nr:hypothetical protein QJS66_21900 [Kocuria rhizophila]